MARPHCFGPVQLEADRFELPAKRLFPYIRVVERHVHDAFEIGGDFKITSPFQRADVSPAQVADKVAEFQHHVLPGPRPQCPALLTSFVRWSLLCNDE